MEATNLVCGRALLVCGGQGDCLAGHWKLNHLATRTTRALVVSPAGALTILLGSLFSTLEASSGNPQFPETPSWYPLPSPLNLNLRFSSLHVTDGFPHCSLPSLPKWQLLQLSLLSPFQPGLKSNSHWFEQGASISSSHSLSIGENETFLRLASVEQMASWWSQWRLSNLCQLAITEPASPLPTAAILLFSLLRLPHPLHIREGRTGGFFTF